MTTIKYISVRGARVNNLKNIDIDIPRNRFTVVTGVSGSGKSSLAFDTVYAEGQRRFVESLSAYARQFLERMRKPDADSITGIPPAVAIGQNQLQKNPRSTVGTTTEIFDHLRILFGRVGKTICHKCGKTIVKDTSDSIAKDIIDRWSKDDKLYIMFPFKADISNIDEQISLMKERGYFRLVSKTDYEIIDIENTETQPNLLSDTYYVLVDRLALQNDKDTVSRITESIEQSLVYGLEEMSVLNLTESEIKNYSSIYECADCGIVYVEPEPKLFTFNSPYGACTKCQGFGRTTGLDDALVFPDKSKSITMDAIHPFRGDTFSKYKRQLIRIATYLNVDVNKPVSELTDDELKVIWEGAPGYIGLDKFFEMLEGEKQKMHYRIMLSKYRGYTVCRSCGGSRLRRSARQVFVGGKNIPELVKMPLEKLYDFFKNIELTEYEMNVGGKLVEEITWRLELLVEIGLEYLTLDRLSHTLSGGEAQRIKLATSLGSQLVGTLYVLDEPSIGLHSRDTEKLIRILYKLKNLGNTVIVVEHDLEIIKSAQNIIDIGPKAGEEGGYLIYSGDYEGLMNCKKSVTADYLSGRKKIIFQEVKSAVGNKHIKILNPRHHNLKMPEVTIPLNLFVCITGVSGSGKSSLVHDIIYGGLKKIHGGYMGEIGGYERIEGFENIEAIEMVDQSPIGKSSRSTPATYIKVFDIIRDVFSNTQESKQMGWKPGYFSFNVPGGRCDVCEGEGNITVDMQFLPDVTLECEACKGTRYKKEVRDLKYRNKSIVDVLNMTIDDAFDFFKDNEKIKKKLSIMRDVGLGYLKLGQPSTQLSGGEAQRVKLAGYLESKSEAHTLFIFDEPTTGLHIDDISKLLICFRRLVSSGHSVLVIEHNLNVISAADYIIDLGPGAGEKGGLVICAGTPEKIMSCTDSFTGIALSNMENP
ncbi:MAG: excinuclease ABC subunit UvrA [bacterium]